MKTIGTLVLTIVLIAANAFAMGERPDEKERRLASCVPPTQLTQDQFLNMLQSIVKHGDLTDSAFIAQTLHMKSMVGPKGAQAHLADTGITISYDVESNSYIQGLRVAPTSHHRAKLTFKNISLFQDCQNLESQKIDQKFGGSFVSSPVNWPGLSNKAQEAFQTSQGFARDGIRMAISYIWDIDGYVYAVSIMQVSP